MSVKPQKDDKGIIEEFELSYCHANFTGKIRLVISMVDWIVNYLPSRANDDPPSVINAQSVMYMTTSIFSVWPFINNFTKLQSRNPFDVLRFDTRSEHLLACASLHQTLHWVYIVLICPNVRTRKQSSCQALLCIIIHEHLSRDDNIEAFWHNWAKDHYCL